MNRNANIFHRWAVVLLTLALLTGCALAEPVAEATLPPMQESFTELYAQNPHVVGWLEMDPDIALPVVQWDNSFYMDHDFDGNENVAGTLFVDSRNTLWPQDDHILIYGHNMKDGSMFGSLNNYRNVGFLRATTCIQFNTIYGDAQYVPFALFDASMTKDDPNYFKLIRLNFSEEQPFDAFLADVQSRSLFDIPVDVNEDDQLLSLVTCSYSMDNGRFIIMCRKLREDETPEQMEALVQQAKSK
ncbi:MAG: class B sortase [Clostridia bacterium]|nr:class B sortase [Clostridia bacterium]